MLFASIAFVALLLGAPANPPGYYGGGRVLATRMPFPTDQADSVRRPGYNGREWVSRPSHNTERGSSRDWNSPGPSAYGAPENSQAVVYVRVGQVVVSINAFERQEGFERRHLEHARQEWLKEHGYVGGVRTFRNDHKPAKSADAGERKVPEPRATIELSPEVTRFRSRMQVQREPLKADSVVKVSAVVESSMASK